MTYNLFLNAEIGDQFKVESIEYELLSKDVFSENLTEVVVKNLSENDVHSIFLYKNTLSAIHEDGYYL